MVFSDPNKGVLSPWAKSCQTLSEVKHHLVSAIKVCHILYNRAAIRCNWNNRKKSKNLDIHVSKELVKEEQELTMKPIITFLQTKGAITSTKLQGMGSLPIIFGRKIWET